MGLFSFRKKDAETVPPKRGSRRSPRTGARTAAGGEYSEHEQLDPLLPEKQRARRRLVGALALVLAAVIILPMVLAPEPKSTTDDIAIQIPGKDASLPPVHVKAAQQSLDSGEEEVRQGVGSSAAAKPDDTGRAADTANAAALKPSAIPTPAPITEPADTANPANPPNPPVVQTPPAKPVAAQAARALPDAKPEIKHEAKPDVKPEPKKDAAATPAPSEKAAGTGHYVIRIGAFASEDRARAWLVKLKLVNVPSYMEKKKIDDRMLYLLRAGPFSDKNSAESAGKKIRDIGLTAQIVEG
ncbi:Cell division protein DedD [Pandoraea terrae]|uniref:Cell division protein DedD n=1 Tax=Pandoraea terrae TaxID=1537710 RepID=A0A5E4VVR7_9BURK|nr:SPOR domain-containing protein [Pandoraea terrae]VVE16231.1 Cell division protein DedD [Pandoraea terrae]